MERNTQVAQQPANTRLLSDPMLVLMMLALTIYIYKRLTRLERVVAGKILNMYIIDNIYFFFQIAITLPWLKKKKICILDIPCYFAMENFSQHMANGDAWVSPEPFYSATKGYKMRLIVC